MVVLVEHLERRHPTILREEDFESGWHREKEAGLLLGTVLGEVEAERTDPPIDPQRVGVTGNSGGGTMTTWVCGVEPRWTMVVSQPKLCRSRAMSLADEPVPMMMAFLPA